MKGALRIALLSLLLLLFVGSGVMLLARNRDYQKGAEMYAEAERLVELPDFSETAPPAPEEPAPPEEPEQPEAPPKPVYVDPYADALRRMDFTALREVNSEVLGWILIPGTAVSYPMVQGADNEYYLNHTWKKWTSAVGAIFLESRSEPDFSDFNTVIYGHRMNNGSMFASLKHYKKQSYWAANPCVYITDDAGSRKYDIFAAYEVSTDGPSYQIGFSDGDSKQAFLDACMAQSVIDTGITPTVNDQVVTLSTCTGNGHATRWVVQGVLRRETPPTPKEEPPVEAPVEVPAEPPTEVPAEAPAQGGETLPPETADPAEPPVGPA